MRKLVLLMCAIGCMLTAKAADPVKQWGQLQVKDGQLCSQTGEPVVLRGVSLESVRGVEGQLRLLVTLRQERDLLDAPAACQGYRLLDTRLSKAVGQACSADAATLMPSTYHVSASAISSFSSSPSFCRTCVLR